MSCGIPNRKERLVAVMMGFAGYAADLGAAPRELHSWIDMLASVRAHVISRDGPVQPDHAERLRHIVSALCDFAPGVGVPLEDVRGWVDGRMEFRDDIHGIMQGMRRGAPDVFDATFAAAAPEPPPEWRTDG